MSRALWVRVLAVPAVTALTVIVSTPAFTSPAPALAVSSTTADPLAGCSADFVDLQPGTNYPNSEVEPSVAVNPTDPSNIVAAYAIPVFWDRARSQPSGRRFQ